jgi:hypothetical protein
MVVVMVVVRRVEKTNLLQLKKRMHPPIIMVHDPLQDLQQVVVVLGARLVCIVVAVAIDNGNLIHKQCNESNNLLSLLSFK